MQGSLLHSAYTNWLGWWWWWWWSRWCRQLLLPLPRGLTPEQPSQLTRQLIQPLSSPSHCNHSYSTHHVLCTALGTGQPEWQAVVGWVGREQWGAAETLPLLPPARESSGGSRQLSFKQRQPHPGSRRHPGPGVCWCGCSALHELQELHDYQPRAAKMVFSTTTCCLRPPAIIQIELL